MGRHEGVLPALLNRSAGIRMAPLHHFNGPIKHMPIGWEAASKAAAAAVVASSSRGADGEGFVDGTDASLQGRRLQGRRLQGRRLLSAAMDVREEALPFEARSTRVLQTSAVHSGSNGAATALATASSAAVKEMRSSPNSKTRPNASTSSYSSKRCGCFSFCNLRDASTFLRLVPDTLPEHGKSPWAHYLRGVYGARWRPPPAGERVEELHRLQLLYARGLPISRCTASGAGLHASHASIRDLSARLDPMCNKSACQQWYADPPVTSRPPMRGVEVYFRRDATLENFAYRWWWRDHSSPFVAAGAWAEVYRWKRPMEGKRHYSYWFVHAKGSGIWVNVGATIAHPNKLNVSLQLEFQYLRGTNRTRVPSSREAAYEILAGHPHGGSPMPLLAQLLGYDSIQTVHTPSYTPELVATDAKSVLGANDANACSEAELRTGVHAEDACTCERHDAEVLNCAEIAWGNSLITSNPIWREGSPHAATWLIYQD